MLCVAAGTWSCDRRKPWVDVAPAEGGFSVSMPTEPRHAIQKASTAHGQLEVHFYEADLERGAVVYSVTRTDYPFDTLAPDKARELLLEAQHDMVRELSAEVIDERATTHQGHPARHTSVRASSGVHYDLIVVLAGSRLFQVFTASRPGKLSDEDRKRFFDSFRIHT